MSKIHLFVHLYSRFIFVGRVESRINRLSAFISQAQNCFHIKDRFSLIFKRNAFPLLVAFEILSG